MSQEQDRTAAIAPLQGLMMVSLGFYVEHIPQQPGLVGAFERSSQLESFVDVNWECSC